MKAKFEFLAVSMFQIPQKNTEDIHHEVRNCSICRNVGKALTSNLANLFLPAI
jgi:hypothetical protein